MTYISEVENPSSIRLAHGWARVGFGDLVHHACCTHGHQPFRIEDLWRLIYAGVLLCQRVEGFTVEKLRECEFALDPLACEEPVVLVPTPNWGPAYLVSPQPLPWVPATRTW